jgi:Tol biopolymer transport system component
MMKRACLLLALLAIVVSGCANDLAVQKISIAPQTDLGNGIYRINIPGGGRELAWSSREDLLLGLTGRDPDPATDCMLWLCGWPEPGFNSEIFVINVQAGERRRIIRTATDEKIISSVFWFPDGEHIGYVVVGSILNRAADVGTWSIRIDGQQDQRISTRIVDPIWSRDGTKFAEHVWSLDKTKPPDQQRWSSSIRVGTIVGEGEQELFQPSDPEAGIYGFSWSPDGTTIAVSYGDDSSVTPELRPGIYFLDVSTGRTLEMPRVKYEEYRYPLFSPDGTLMAFEREQPAFYRTTTVIRDLKTGCQIELPLKMDYHEMSWSPDGSRLLLPTDTGYYMLDLREYLAPVFQQTGSICP